MRRVRSQFLQSGVPGASRRPLTPRGALAVAITAVTCVAALGVGVAPASAAVVTVTLDGSAKGSVTSEPAGLNCSNIPDSEATDCSFDFGFQFFGITLSAASADGAALKQWAGNVGGTCSGGTNPCQTASIGLDPLQVTATFAPEPGRPVVATGAAGEISFPSAVLSGSVNPNSTDFGISDCYFEYGPSADYGLKAPCRPGSSGPGTDALPVTGEAALLASNTTYHYRVVAMNAGGRSVGADKTFTSAAAPADACANATIRAQQGAIAQRLPDCLAYELVSPPSTAGEPVLPSVVSPPGNDVLFSSVGGFADVENLMNLGALYRAHRTAGGWTTSAVGGPPAAEFPFFSTEFEWTTDWWKVDRPLTMWAVRPVADPSEFQVQMVGRKGGPWHPVSPSLAAGLGASVVATSTDLSGVVFRGDTRLPMTDGTTDTRTGARASLTVSKRNADGTIELRQVAQQNGTTFLPTCALVLGTAANGVTRGAVARDGLSRIVFSTSGTGCTTAARQRVWASEPFSANPDVFDVSASRCTTDCGTPQRATFVGGSLDATRLYLTTAEKLLDADTHPGVDLYEYDFRRPTSERLRLVTGNDTPANVLGAVAVSDDGNRVYFVARGELSGAITGDTAPVLGTPNLYVRTTNPSGDSSVTRFIATLSEGDSSQWGSFQSLAMTPDGRYLALTSEAVLTPGKLAGDTLRDVYRIDGETGTIVRAWTNSPDHNGPNRQAGAVVSGRSATGTDGSRERGHIGRRSIADDGSAIYFSSAEPLEDGDVNAKDDAFVWSASTGALTMVSDGRDIHGVTPQGMSADGTTFFFNSSSRLVPQHTSTSIGLYAARRGGGFPAPEPPAAPCAGDACQGAGIDVPPATPIASDRAGGGGNASPAVRKTLRVGSISRKARRQAARRGVLRVRVRTSRAGFVRVLARAKIGKRTRRVGGRKVRARKAGAVTVKLRLNRAAKRRLQRGQVLRVTLRVASPGARTRTATVRLKRGQRS
jgi:hypothetical protein